MTSGLFSLPLSTLPELSAPAVRASSATPVISRSFFAGPENALVRALAAAAGEADPRCNPLVLCGVGGVGKSSVAQALAALHTAKFGLKRVVSTTGSDLVRGLAAAIESDAAGDFRSRFHDCELLVVDELQRLAGKAAAQQFLVSALDVLMQRGALVLLTLPRLPQATEGLSPALASRLAGGLIVTLHPPGPAARRRLVQQAAEELALPLTDDELNQLAGSTEPEARGGQWTAPRIKSAVVRRAAAASHSKPGSHSQMEPSQANLPHAHPPQPSAAADPKTAFRASSVLVARHFDLTLAALKGKSRQQHVADARALAMFVARRLTGLSYAQIGRYFGNRDHSTVLHACQKTERRLAADDATRRLLDELLAQVSASEGAS